MKICLFTRIYCYSFFIFKLTKVLKLFLIWEKYKKRLSEIQASTQGEGSTFQRMPLPQLSTEIHMNIWKEVVGLTKKGKIYGFGMEGSCASTIGPPTSTKVSIELLEKEKELKKKLKKRLNWVEKHLDHTTKQLDQTTK